MCAPDGRGGFVCCVFDTYSALLLIGVTYDTFDRQSIDSSTFPEVVMMLTTGLEDSKVLTLLCDSW